LKKKGAKGEEKKRKVPTTFLLWRPVNFLKEKLNGKMERDRFWVIAGRPTAHCVMCEQKNPSRKSEVRKGKE